MTGGNERKEEREERKQQRKGKKRKERGKDERRIKKMSTEGGARHGDCLQ